MVREYVFGMEDLVFVFIVMIEKCALTVSGNLVVTCVLFSNMIATVDYLHSPVGMSRQKNAHSRVHVVLTFGEREGIIAKKDSSF